MAWCPQCKEEYEDHVEKCADCDIPLVASLEEISTDRMLLVLNSNDEAERVIEFLHYSGTESARIETTRQQQDEYDSGQQEEVYTIYVAEKEWEASMKYMQAFMAAEREEPDKEDFYFNDYEMLVIDGRSDMDEMKSSYVSLIVIGGGVSLLGVLNVLGVFNFMTTMLSYMMLVFGLMFVGGGLLTYKKAKEKAILYDKRKELFDTIIRWYESEKGIDSLNERHDIVIQEGMDPGAEYFVYMDVLVNELKEYPDTIEEAMINTVADYLYHQLKDSASDQ